MGFRGSDLHIEPGFGGIDLIAGLAVLLEVEGLVPEIDNRCRGFIGMGTKHSANPLKGAGFAASGPREDEDIERREIQTLIGECGGDENLIRF